MIFMEFDQYNPGTEIRHKTLIKAEDIIVVNQQQGFTEITTSMGTFEVQQSYSEVMDIIQNP